MAVKSNFLACENNPGQDKFTRTKHNNLPLFQPAWVVPGATSLSWCRLIRTLGCLQGNQGQPAATEESGRVAVCLGQPERINACSRGALSLSKTAREGIDLSITALEHPSDWIQSKAEDRLGASGASATARSARALDWFTFFLSDVQTGFGPFVAIYLTAHQWAQVDIGLVLTAGSLVALAAQMPGGALVDAVRSTKFLAGIAVVAICASALALALWPSTSERN